MRIIHVFAVVIAASAVSACALEADDPSEASGPSEASSEEALAASPPAFDVASLPAGIGWDVIAAEDQPAGTVFVTAPVTAAVACPSGLACLYQNSNRGPRMWGTNGQFPNLRLKACPECTNGTHGNDGTFNDQMTSWENRSGKPYCWYVNANFGPPAHTMRNGVIQNVLPAENDTASSMRPC